MLTIDNIITLCVQVNCLEVMGKNKDERIYIRVSKEQKEKIKKEASKEGKTVSEKITEYIDSL